MFGHPLFYSLVRVHARAALRKKGLTRSQVNDAIDAATDDVVDAAVAESKATPPAPGAFGDGTIIQAIIDFLKSPAGQQIIAILIQIILAAFGL